MCDIIVAKLICPKGRREPRTFYIFITRCLYFSQLCRQSVLRISRTTVYSGYNLRNSPISSTHLACISLSSRFVSAGVEHYDVHRVILLIQQHHIRLLHYRFNVTWSIWGQWWFIDTVDVS